MKKVYCDLQKAHMKQLKSETSGHKTEQELKRTKKKGFVANCLLKVTCSGEGGADVKQLKVQCQLYLISLVQSYSSGNIIMFVAGILFKIW